MMDTFAERQAYIEKCQLQMREQQAQIDRSKAVYEEFNAKLQAFWLQYNLEMTTLIYRGMFDPNFCKPSASKGIQENTMDREHVLPTPRPWACSLHRPRLKLHPVFWGCVVGACFWGCVWWVLK